LKTNHFNLSGKEDLFVLAIREDIDYRLIYMNERAFHGRVSDVYVAKQTHQRPPYFHDILEELVDIEAGLFLLHSPEAFSDMSEYKRKELEKLVQVEDPDAIAIVFERMSVNFIEMFAKDLFLFLLSHNLAFLEKDFYNPIFVDEHNRPIQEVW
jgi:hypothetical protein